MAFLTATPRRRKSAHQQAQQPTKHEAEGKQQETSTPLVTQTNTRPRWAPPRTTTPTGPPSHQPQGSLPTVPRHLVTFRQ